MAAKYVLIILGVFFGDLWMKNGIESMTEEEMEKRRAHADMERPCHGKTGRRHGLITVRRHHNRGAVLNFGENQRRAVTAAALTMTGILTAIFILSLGHKGCRMLKTGLSLLLGGAFSNAYDRLKRGYVVDYFSINVKWKPLRRIVFNLSDFCIIIGAMLVAIGV